MPIYEFDLSDGTTLTVESETEPTDEQVLGALQTQEVPVEEPRFTQNLGQVLSAPQPELPPQTIPYTGIPESMAPRLDWERFQAGPTFAEERTTGVPSAAGLTPEIVPPGTEIAKSPAFPAIRPFLGLAGMVAPETAATIASSAAKTGIGISEYLTSPQGVTELVGSMSPARLLVFGKWFVDMAKGTFEEAGTLSALLAKPNKTPEDWQAISDHTVSGIAMFLGAAGAGYKTGQIAAGYLPKGGKIKVEDRSELINRMEEEMRAAQQARFGSPFTRELPIPSGEVVPMQTGNLPAGTIIPMEGAPVPWRVAEPLPQVRGPRIQPPSAPMAPGVNTGRAAENLRMMLEEEQLAAQQAKMGSPFVRELPIPPEATIPMQGPGQLLAGTIIPMDGPPLPWRVAEPLPAVRGPTVQPPSPPMAPGPTTGRAAQAVRVSGEAAQRMADWEKAMAEKVAKEQEQPAHPDKPLTENQLRIIRESLEKQILEGQIPGERKGVIVGSALEAWADGVIKQGPKMTNMGVDPRLAAAAIVKGAALLERGITNAVEWTAAMIREHGEEIRPFLGQIRRDAEQVRARTFTQQPPEAGGLGMAQPPQPEPAAQATPPTTAPLAGTTLTDVYQRFEPVQKPLPSLKGVGAKVVESVRTGMASKFRPIDKLSEDIAKAYNASTPRNIAGIFEQLKGSTGRGEADIYRFDRDVSSLVKGAEKDFNAYMFLRRSLDRLRMDLADIERAQRGEEVPVLNRRKVSDYTIPELEAKLRLLESNLGSERVRQFEEAANRYQTYMDNALQLQVESGRMSPEIYNAIKSGNQFYAPFKVMKYFEEIAKPEGTGRKIDTLADYTKAMTGIEDPNFRLGDMLGAARQNILLSRILADKNNAMRRLAQLAEFDPDGIFIRRIEPGVEVPSDLGTVNVKENGKVVQYAVNKDVQQAIQSMGPNTESILVQFMGYAAIPMKAGATSLNIPFQVSNLLADVPRQALVSRYGIHSAADLVRYPIDFMRSAYSQIAGEVFKSDNRIFLDFLDSGAAGATIQEHLTPSALRFRPSSLEKTSKDFGKSVLYTLPDFAKAIEQISKSVGVQRAMRLHGATSGKELASFFPEAITEIRRFSGSPDFGRQGRWVEGARLNLIYMFFNARLQGTISDLGRLAGRDGAKTGARTWVNMAAAVGIPTLYLYALNHSDEYREDYLKRPEQERQNYWLIPKDTFITNEQGERIRDYWRIPKRESAKWFANFTESAMNFYNEHDAEQLGAWAEAALTDISPVNFQGETFQERVESMASSLNPVMKAPLELATGRDLYRHRSIVPESMKKASPEQQFIERTPEVFRQLAQVMPDVSPEVFRSPMMLENMVKNFTAGMVLQFLPRKPIEGRSGIENLSLLQRFQAVPYTDSGEFENRMKLLEREATDMQLERFRNAKAILNANKNATLKSLITKTKEKHGIDPRLFERVADIYIAEQRGINNQERRILSLPVQQRAQFLNDEFRGMNPEQKKNAIREYAKKRILTESVAAELLKLQTAPAP